MSYMYVMCMPYMIHTHIYIYMNDTFSWYFEDLFYVWTSKFFHQKFEFSTFLKDSHEFAQHSLCCILAEGSSSASVLFLQMRWVQGKQNDLCGSPTVYRNFKAVIANNIFSKRNMFMFTIALCHSEHRIPTVHMKTEAEHCRMWNAAHGGAEPGARMWG